MSLKTTVQGFIEINGTINGLVGQTYMMLNMNSRLPVDVQTPLSISRFLNIDAYRLYYGVNLLHVSVVSNLKGFVCLNSRKSVTLSCHILYYDVGSSQTCHICHLPRFHFAYVPCCEQNRGCVSSYDHNTFSEDVS